jgi:hypothetical protein
MTGSVVQSSRSSGDWATTGVIAFLMLVGVVFGIRKLPRATS